MFGLFGRVTKTDLAKALVQTSRLNAVGSFSAFAKRHPLARDFDLEKWDFFTTVAGVYAAFSSVELIGLPIDEVYRLRGLILKDLANWDSDNAPNALFDAGRMITSESTRLMAMNIETSMVLPYAMGAWIFLNVVGTMPETKADMEYALSVGEIVTHAFCTGGNPTIKS